MEPALVNSVKWWNRQPIAYSSISKLTQSEKPFDSKFQQNLFLSSVTKFIESHAVEHIVVIGTNRTNITTQVVIGFALAETKTTVITVAVANLDSW